MGRPRTRLPWQYDAITQTFTTPAGVVSLQELAELRYGHATSHVDLTGPWSGWRIRGNTLRAPRNGPTITVKPDTAQQFARWLIEAEKRDGISLGITPATRPHLYAVK